LVKADDFDRFTALQWGIRTWDVWNFTECDPRFGDDWPGRIPAQYSAKELLYGFMLLKLKDIKKSTVKLQLSN